MQFFRMEDYFAATRITGPRHNMLQIRLDTAVQGEPQCECLRPVNAQQRLLDEEKLISRVIQGVTDASAQLAVHYAVTHIRYAGDDSGPEEVYALLAGEIVRRLASGGDFRKLENHR